MITNFEEITADLTADERRELHTVATALKNFNGPGMAIKGPRLQVYLSNNYFVEVSGPRLRKMVNFLRSRRILPVVATSRGYYVSNDQTELTRQIKSMEERAAAIKAAADGLRVFLANQPQAL